MSRTCIPDPKCWKAFDSQPDQRLVPIFEEISHQLRPSRRSTFSQSSWKRLKFRMALASQGVDQEALAIGILIKHPDWRVEKIAATAGVHRGTLHRWQKFKLVQQTLLELAKDEYLESVPRGVKLPDPDQRDTAGSFDAWSEEDHDSATDLYDIE